MRLAVTALLAGLLATGAAAQTSYYADLDGAHEVPANGSTAGGWARVTLNAGNTVTYDVRVWGLTGTAAHIHPGAVGVNGPPLVTLSGGPTIWFGTSAALTAPQVAQLKTLGMYINVHTAALPAGEIRGQLEGRPRKFGAFLNAAQETPVSTSTAKGSASFVVDLATTDLTYTETWNGAGGTNSHIHKAPLGVAGGIEVVLLGGPVTWAGVENSIGDLVFSDLQARNDYANIHSVAKPAGEIRGQIVPSGIKYGDVTQLTMDFEITGAPVSGGTINLAITGGNPGGVAQLMIALDPHAGLLKGVPLLVAPGSLIVTSILLPLDGTGSIAFPAVLPDIGATLDVYMQAFSTSAGPLKASNGVRLPLVDLLF